MEDVPVNNNAGVAVFFLFMIAVMVALPPLYDSSGLSSGFTTLLAIGSVVWLPIYFSMRQRRPALHWLGYGSGLPLSLMMGTGNMLFNQVSRLI